MNTSAISPPTAVVETLERLSSKLGVVAALAIDRLSSTVLASTGNLSALSVSAGKLSSPISSTFPTTVSGPKTNMRTSFHESTASLSASVGSTLSNATSSTAKPIDPTSEFASRIWHYVNLSGQLVHDIDTEDDLKLLRLRTKKYEFMIVPDAKYIFVVVHEVSP